MLLTPLNHSVIFVNEAKNTRKSWKKSIAEFEREREKKSGVKE
jgi:hypothetical protein